MNPPHPAAPVVPSSPSGLSAILAPRAIAVIGASREPTSMSGRLFRNLRATFSGPLFPINPRASDVDSVAALPNLAAAPQPVDLAFIAVPAASVLDVVGQCAAHGVRGLVTITAGFSETGAAGQQLEAELLAAVRAAGMRLVGPNCFGVLSTVPGQTMNGTFATVEVRPGRVAVGTQSGALAQVLLQALRKQQLGVSSLVSLGNKADVNENDLLEYWVHDPATDVIVLYLESFADPRGFRRIAERIVPHKPIVVLKAGRTELGHVAAGSHTAALASPERLTAALLRAAGVVSVATIAELVGATAVLAKQPLPRGRRVGLLTNAGGAAVLCADELSARGLVMPRFSPALREALAAGIRPEATVSNPVDLVGSISGEDYERALHLLLASDETDAVVSLCVPREAGTATQVATGVAAAGTQHRDKPLVSVFMDSAELPDELATDAANIPRYLYPESAARSLAIAAAVAERRRRPNHTVPVRVPFDVAAARGLLADGWLDPAATHHLLFACGLSTPKWSVASSLEEAIEAARRIGRPVAVKAIAPTQIHKSVTGGVALNISGNTAVAHAFDQITGLTGTSTALIQEFVPGGLEVLIGVTFDRAFGHLLAFGLGGVFVELLRDVTYRLLPLTERDADELLNEGRVAQLLAGFRGPPCDTAALKDALLRVSTLATDLPEIVELDLNPLKVLPPGQGVTVVDARVRVDFASR